MKNSDIVILIVVMALLPYIMLAASVRKGFRKWAAIAKETRNNK